MRSMVFLSLTLLTIGCGPKTPATPAPAEEAVKIDVSMPDSPDASAFATQIIEQGISDWSPTGSRDFKWTSADFHADGSLKVQAKIDVGGETMECPETGTWSIDSVDSASSGILEWTIVKTSCATREDGAQQRVQLTYTGSEAKISFR